MAEAAKKTKDSAEEKVTAAPQKTKPDFLSVLISFLVLLNLATVGGMGFYMKKMWARMQVLEAESKKSAEESSEKAEDSGLGKELEPRNMGTLFPIESFLVNISSDQGPKFLQAQMELELSDAAVEEEIARKKAAVRDAVIVLLSSRSYKELREPAGLKKLRKDIVASINHLLASGKVREVYFTQFHFN